MTIGSRPVADCRECLLGGTPGEFRLSGCRNIGETAARLSRPRAAVGATEARRRKLESCSFNSVPEQFSVRRADPLSQRTVPANGRIC